MLREAVSGIGLAFFPIAALLLFIAVYVSVLGRSFLTKRKGYWKSMSSFVLDETEPAGRASKEVSE